MTARSNRPDAKNLPFIASVVSSESAVALESCLGSVEPPVGGRTFVYIGEKEASHVAYN